MQDCATVCRGCHSVGETLCTDETSSNRCWIVCANEVDRSRASKTNRNRTAAGFINQCTSQFNQGTPVTVLRVTVLLTVEKLKEKERRQKAEVTLHVKGRDIFIEQSNEDLYAAIDQLMDKLDRQVMRHKDRLQDHHHTSPKRQSASAV